MTADELPRSRDLREILGTALQAWRVRPRLSELASPLVDWIRSTVRAERCFLFGLLEGGDYRFRLSQDADGDSIPDPASWVSHFVVGRVQGGADALYFADTRKDRRFRTEGERVAGTKTRSILAIPIAGEHASSILYFDARFGTLEWPTHCPGDVELVLGLLRLALEKDGLEQENRSAKRQLRRAQEKHSHVPAPARSAVKIGDAAPREVNFEGFVTRCPSLIAGFDELRRLAGSELPLLIEGESGTGKEVLARAVHKLSERTGPFVSLHCGAIPEALVEIELFGHAKGAFTGADKPRAGLVAMARGGTLFLDDVGEMPPELQNALLRVLESGSYRPVSGDEEESADVRVVASALVGSEGEHTTTSVRHDLFYRLAGARILIPPLRDRGEDILLLAHRFLATHAGDQPESTFTREIESAMLTYHWPGNARQLENLIRRSVALGLENLSVDRFAQFTGFAIAPDQASGGDGTDIQSVLDRAERDVIIRTLQEHTGNKSLAAKVLGISRKTLYRRMEKHRIPL